MADIRITPAASVMAFTSSLNFKETLTQEASGSLTLLGSGSTGRTDLFTINGNNGTLFSVSDDLSNSLFSVNTIAGLPVIEAFADNTVVMGQYGQNVLVITGSNVGIGTSSPVAKLHVGGTSYFTDEQSILYTNAVQTMYGGTGYSLFRIYGNSNSVEMQMDVHSSNSGAATIGTYTNNGVYIKTNNTNRITITSGGLVGIGTTDPQSKLHVYTDADAWHARIGGASGELRIGGQTSNGAVIQAYTPGGSVRDLYLQRDGGYVGIGTTGLITKLTLNSYAGSRLPYIQSTDYSIDAGGITIGSSTTTGNKAGGIDLTNNIYGVGYFSPIVTFSSLSSNSVYNNAYAGIWGVVAGQGSDANWVKGDLAFGTAVANGIVERMRIASDGNVGIGTTSPTYGKLSVSSGNFDGVRIDTNSTYNAISIGGTGKFTIDAPGIAGGRFIVLDNGNVGIGTTGPDTNLDVIGDSLTVGSESTYAFRVRGGGGGKPITISSDGSYAYIQSWSGGPLQINNQGNNILLNATSGNVGIGTTTPQKRLDAISDANDFITVGANAISVGQWSGIHFGYRENNTNYRKSAIVFERTDLTSNNAQGKVHILNGPQSGGGSATLSDAKITIAENGNVGIGITSPSYKLHVLDEVFVGNSSALRGIIISGDANSRIDFNYNSTSTGQITCGNSSNLFIDALGSRAIEFAIAGTSKMEVSPNGNVGIGTAGNVEASAALEVKSNTQGFLLPRMDDGEMNAIGGPAIGLMVYNTSDDYVYVFGGASWAKLAYV